MKTSQNQVVRTPDVDSGEETLRLIAGLPAPEGLVDRVQTRLRTAPRSSRVLAWPLAFASGGWAYGSAVRGAAAAAIVCVVAGGGWRVYSHVQPGPSARVIVMPTPAGPPRGFSIGGSVHTPDPMRGLVLTHQVVAEPAGTVTGEPVQNPRKATDPARNAPARKPGKRRTTSSQQPLRSVPE
jgi:hypothetical protein